MSLIWASILRAKVDRLAQIVAAPTEAVESHPAITTRTATNLYGDGVQLGEVLL